MNVAMLLKHKGHAVAHVAPTATVADVTRTLADHRIGAVLVLDAARQLLGIVSERDIVRRLSSDGAHVLEMTAAQIMTHNVRTVTPQAPVMEAMEVMTKGRFRHLPVMDDGKLLGIVSIGDIVKARIDETEHEVESLKAYVAS